MNNVTMKAAEEKPKTLAFSAFYRSRDDLVGQDEAGASLKFTYGLKDNKAEANQKAAAKGADLMQAAMLAGASNVAGFSEQVIEASFGQAVIDARLEVDTMRQRVTTARQGLVEARQGLVETQRLVRKADGDEKHVVEKHALAQENYDESELSLARAERELASAEASFASAEVQLAEGRTVLARPRH